MLVFRSCQAILSRNEDARSQSFAAVYHDWHSLTCFRNLVKLDLGDRSNNIFFLAMAVRPATLAALTTLSLLEEFVRA